MSHAILKKTPLQTKKFPNHQTKTQHPQISENLVLVCLLCNCIKHSEIR